MQLARRPFSLAAESAGKSMPAKIAIMAMTTSNSMRVKASVRIPCRWGFPNEATGFAGIGLDKREGISGLLVDYS